MSRYMSDPEWVHVEEAEAALADAASVVDRCIEDLTTLEEELAFTEDCMHAVKCLADRTRTRTDCARPVGHPGGLLYVGDVDTVLAAWVANDRDFIYSVLAVAGEGWDS
jgi:Tfp pilus assembly protein PilX